MFLFQHTKEIPPLKLGALAGFEKLTEHLAPVGGRGAAAPGLCYKQLVVGRNILAAQGLRGQNQHLTVVIRTVCLAVGTVIGLRHTLNTPYPTI